MSRSDTQQGGDGVTIEAIATLEAAGLRPVVVDACPVPGCESCGERSPIAA